MANSKVNGTDITKPEWFFENSDDELMQVETKVYENGNKVKRVKLSTGKYAQARELTGKDMRKVDQISGGKKDEYLPALMITSTVITDEAGGITIGITMEELDDMKGKDYNMIKTLATMLNF